MWLVAEVQSLQRFHPAPVQLFKIRVFDHTDPLYMLNLALIRSLRAALKMPVSLASTYEPMDTEGEYSLCFLFTSSPAPLCQYNLKWTCGSEVTFVKLFDAKRNTRALCQNGEVIIGATTIVLLFYIKLSDSRNKWEQLNPELKQLRITKMSGLISPLLTRCWLWCTVM